jgi:hypothetical protein
MTPQLTSALPKSYDFTILIMILTTMNATTTIEARENIVPKDESESSSTFLNSYAREKRFSETRSICMKGIYDLLLLFLSKTKLIRR